MTIELIMCIVFVLKKERQNCSQSLKYLSTGESFVIKYVTYRIADGVLLLIKLSLHGLSFHWAFLLVVGCWGPCLRLS